MIELEPLLQDITALTPLAIGLVAVAGLVVGIAPSSFPLISVAAGLAAGQGPTVSRNQHMAGLWLSLGFALGIATVDTALGALFGLAGFGVLRILASYLAVAYLLLAVVLLVAALALLRVIHLVIPIIGASARPAKSFLGSYLVGIPFGLSTCPACTPLLLPVVAAAATTANPVMGAVLMGTFGIARGIPIVIAGTAVGGLAHVRRTHRFTLWAERIGAALMVAAATYFLYQAAFYAGWIQP
ncbi:MAG: cytochrome c biogenesis CcdA family protein [Hyphomicrobiaceae bacterium]